MFSKGTIISGKYFGKSLHSLHSRFRFEYCHRKSLEQCMALQNVLRGLSLGVYGKKKVKVPRGSEISAERLGDILVGKSRTAK